MEIIEILQDARERIEDPTRWTYGETARDRFGRGCDASGAEAVRWCAWGSLIRTMEDKGHHIGSFYDENNRTYTAAMSALERAAGYILLFNFNDGKDHSEVLDLFDRAIAHLQEEDNGTNDDGR